MRNVNTDISYVIYCGYAMLDTHISEQRVIQYVTRLEEWITSGDWEMCMGYMYLEIKVTLYKWNQIYKYNPASYSVT